MRQEAKDAALQDITAMKAELDERRSYVLSLEGQVEQQTLDLLIKVSICQFDNHFLKTNTAHQDKILPNGQDKSIPIPRPETSRDSA